jgi:hypothetical protein
MIGCPRFAASFYIKGVTMMTLSVCNDLYQQASEAAAAQGRSVDDFVLDALRNAIALSRLRRTTRNGLPVMMVPEQTPTISTAKVSECLKEEGL